MLHFLLLKSQVCSHPKRLLSCPKAQCLTIQPSCCMNGLGILSSPSVGQIRTTEVPLQTTNPNILVSSVSLYGSSGSRRYSVVLSSTRFRRGSKPFRVPAASRPPANFTLMLFSRYFDRSRIVSFLFFSLWSPWPA